MIDRKTVLEQQKHVSENITSLCRYVGFGVAAACYALFTSDTEFARGFVSSQKFYLLVAATFAVLTIFFDYLQFFSGYRLVRNALKTGQQETFYDEKSLAWKARFAFFYLKQVALFASIVFMLLSLSIYLV